LLSSHPNVYSRVLKNSDRFIIFGSGGFWKLISNEKAARVVNTSPRDTIAERLVTLALEKGANERGKDMLSLEIPASNCVSGNKRPNGEGMRPEMNSYIGRDNEVRQSEFRNFYVKLGNKMP
jgi:hypothetical protein